MPRRFGIMPSNRFVTLAPRSSRGFSMGNALPSEVPGAPLGLTTGPITMGISTPDDEPEPWQPGLGGWEEFPGAPPGFDPIGPGRDPDPFRPGGGGYGAPDEPELPEPDVAPAQLPGLLGGFGGMVREHPWETGRMPGGAGGEEPPEGSDEWEPGVPGGRDPRDRDRGPWRSPYSWIRDPGPFPTDEEPDLPEIDDDMPDWPAGYIPSAGPMGFRDPGRATADVPDPSGPVTECWWEYDHTDCLPSRCWVQHDWHPNRITGGGFWEVYVVCVKTCFDVYRRTCEDHRA